MSFDAIDISPDNPAFVFDANFFIALKEVKAFRPYEQLSFAKKDLGIQLFVSAQVFNECPFITGQDFQEFNKGVQIDLVRDDELEQIKTDLKKRGVKAIAQDNDLSLIALAHRIRKNVNEVAIVSDDFKLAQNVESLQYRIKTLSLPAFLQFVSKNIKGNSRDYFRNLNKRVLRLNLDYMMSRKETYAPQAKIAWLIENAVDVAEDGIVLKRTDNPEDKEKEALDEEKKLMIICEDYIANKSISPDKFKLIEPYEAALKGIRQSREMIKEVKSLLGSDVKKALNLQTKANNHLIHLTQLMGTKLSETHYQTFEKIMSAENSKINFLRAFILIGANKVASALESLNNAALFATMARSPDTILSINYLIALVYVFNSLYNKAVEQFKFIQQLAENYKQDLIQVKAAIGEAITLYLTGQQSKALKLMESFNETKVKISDIVMMNALIDSGDYYSAMGLPEISSNLYTQALECAVDGDQDWKFNIILSKLKFSYMASSLKYTEKTSTDDSARVDISGLIDKIHILKKMEKFNDLLAKLGEFTNMLYIPFEFFTKGPKPAKYYEIPEKMRESFDCVKIKENEETGRTYLIGYNEDIGLIAFDVQLDRTLEGVPENYGIKLQSTAQVKIIPPDGNLASSLLVRAVVLVADEARDLQIKRNIPAFFSSMKI